LQLLHVLAHLAHFLSQQLHLIRFLRSQIPRAHHRYAHYTTPSQKLCSHNISSKVSYGAAQRGYANSSHGIPGRPARPIQTTNYREEVAAGGPRLEATEKSAS